MSNSVNASTSRSRVVASPDVEPTQPDFRSSYAKYIGRVGALAVALGVGVAVATGSGGGLGAGVAYAQSEGDGADGGGQGAGAGEGTGEGAGVGAGEAPGDLNPAEVPVEEQAGDGDGEPGEGSGNGNGAGVPEMNLNVGGDAQIKGDEEQTQNELGEGQGERQGENEGQDEGEGEGQNEGQGGGLAQSGTGGGVTSYVAPSGNSPVAGAPIVIVPSKPGPSGTTGAGSGQGLIDPSASRLAGGENSMSLFSLNNETQNLQLTTAAAAGTPAPAPLVQQPSNPIEAALGSVVAVANIATTAVATFVSSVLAPGPDTPAPPMMLFVVLGWAQRELQRTFFNQRPTAVVDSTTTSEDLDVDINVLGNDTDPDINTGTDGNPYPGDRLTITDYTQPTNGSVVLNSDGTFTYTPDADFNGTDMFTYTVSDEASPWHLHGLAGFFGGGGHTSTTTVTIGVTPVNDAPTADDDAFSTDEDTAVNGTLPAGSDVDGDALTYTITQAPTNGTLTNFDPQTGAYTYTPDAEDLDTGETRTDSFTYVVNDGTVNSDTATVSITITGVNDAPVAVNDVQSTDEDTPLTFTLADLLANDTDAEDDTLTPFVNLVVTPPSNGTLTLDGTGTFTYTPNADAQTLDDGETRTDTFTYLVSDGDATSNTATVTITITGVNDAPVAVNDVATTDEDTAVTGNVLANDTDIDGETLTVTTTSPMQGTYGTLTIGQDGAYTYTPGGGQFTLTDPAQVTQGTYNSVYYVAGNKPYIAYTFVPTNTQTYVIEQVGIPRDTTLFIYDGAFDPASENTNLIARDDDSGPGLTPRLTVDLTAGQTYTIVNSVFGTGGSLDLPATFTINGPGVVPGASSAAQALDDGETGVDTFTYTVTDGDATDTATVTITVNGVNDAPVAADDAFSTDEDTPVNEILPAGSDVDVEPLSYTLTGPGPQHGVITNFNSETGAYTYTPNAQDLDTGETRTDSFTYVVNDGTTNSNTATVSITITGVNDAPTAVDDAFSTDEDTAVNGTLPAGSDVDGDALTYVITQAPTNGTLTNFDPETGAYTYTPNAQDLDTGETRTDSFTYVVDDGDATSNTATVTITITGVNDAPVAADATLEVEANTSITAILPAGTDVDGDTLTYVIVQAPANGTISGFNPATGAYTYTPNAGHTGPDSFLYTVYDSDLLDATPATVSVQVGPITIPGTGFDDGTLAGWQAGPGVTVINGPLTNNTPSYPDGTPARTWVHTPYESGTAASLSPSSTTFASAVTALGLTAAEQQAIAAATPQTETNAAWMTRTVHLQAGTTYTMSWNFLSGDYVPFDDGSITSLVYQGSGPAPTVVINGENANYALLGYTTAPGNYSTGSYGATGWQTATYQVSQTGDYLLGFAVYNGGDGGFTPTLLVDDQPGTTLRDGQPFTLPPETV